MPPLAVNALIANNLVLSSALSSLTQSNVVIGGSLTLEANNDAGIEASNSAVIESGGVAVGVTLAFNTIGWQPQDIFRKSIDGLLGTDLGKEAPVVARAWVESSELEVGSNLDVRAAVVAEVVASTSNEASSVGASAAASLVLATNFVSSWADAFIVEPVDSIRKIKVDGALSVNASDAPSVVAETTIVAASAAEAQSDEFEAYARVDFSSEDGPQTLSFGKQVMVAADHEAGGTGGMIYRYMGGTPQEIDLSTTDFSDAGYWYELVNAEGKAGELLDLVEQAKTKFGEIQDILNPPDSGNQTPAPSEDGWSNVEKLAGQSSSAKSESQIYTLPDAAAGAVFSLAIGSDKTGPIDLLTLNQPTDELQRLTVLRGPLATGQSYTLSMGADPQRTTTLVFNEDAGENALAM